MKICGAILAGGQSRRFGSDKASALLDGRRLIDRVLTSLGPQCDEVVVCGREEPGYISLPDKPASGLGPLAGLNSALIFTAERGFCAVLSSGCDVPDLPSDIAQQLAGEGAAIVADQPVIGFWPIGVQQSLETYLREGGRSLYGFAERVEARFVDVDPPLRNINRPSDLAR